MAARKASAALAAAACVAQAAALCEIDVGGVSVSVASKGQTAFQLRIVPAGAALFENPMVYEPAVAKTERKAREALDGESCEASSDLGALSVSADGVVVLKDAKGKTLTTSDPISSGGRLALSTAAGKLYGRGAAPQDAQFLTATTVKPKVYNRATYAPYYYSTDGYSALGAVKVDRNTGPEMDLNYTTDGSKVTWTYGQGAFELHLMPAPTLKDGTMRYYELIGRPVVPPRYIFGFGASRWGWESSDYVKQVLSNFTVQGFPLDYMIIDFEWFMNETDYDYDEHGKPYYNDFGWNPALFDEPAKQLENYRSEYGVRMAGIRKPRIGNAKDLKMLKENGWILPNGEPGGSYPPEGHYADGRSVDYSIPAARAWYAKEMEHYTNGTWGVDFWWNDEGETNYYTFWYWNVAQNDALKATSPDKRFFSLNRAWSPGMARIGAAVWTGDVNADWQDLADTPAMMLNWVLGGAPYVGCDIGGFNGETNGPHLTRWLQVGVFMPVMRVHSVIWALPHFPWNFGEAAASAIRKTLQLRYRLVPYHYSLAHRLYATHENWIMPLVAEFPNDTVASDIVTQWMDGDILCAPVVTENSTKSIYLPAGSSWYTLAAGSNSTVLHQGGQHLTGAAELGEIPAFVRPGSILPLADPVQNTGFLQGATLRVEVYAGADGSFDFVDDDSETMLYTTGERRVVSMRWDNTFQVFSWAVQGDFLMAPDVGFSQLEVTIFSSTGAPITVGPSDIGEGGTFILEEGQLRLTE